MENISYIALSRQMSLQRALEVTANNVANMNTPGFKGEHARFETFMASPDRPGPKHGLQTALVIDQATVRDLAPGSIEKTDNPLDVALNGDGYLMVQSPEGTRYTRNGHLSLDAERRLVDVNGLPVLDGNNQPIAIPEGVSDITITGTGEISTEAGQLTRLGLVRFDNEASMVSEGAGLLSTSEAPKQAIDTRVVQGSYEQSNVQGVVEMTTLIDVSRQYQSTQNMIESEHERLRSAIQRLGRKPQ